MSEVHHKIQTEVLTEPGHATCTCQSIRDYGRTLGLRQERSRRRGLSLHAPLHGGGGRFQGRTWDERPHRKQAQESAGMKAPLFPADPAQDQAALQAEKARLEARLCAVNQRLAKE